MGVDKRSKWQRRPLLLNNEALFGTPAGFGVDKQQPWQRRPLLINGQLIDPNDIDPTLGTLSLSETDFVIGVPASGSIIGATSGSTIAAIDPPGGLTINSGARTFAWSGSGDAGDSTFTLRETLAGATNTPHDTEIDVSITGAEPTGFGTSLNVDFYPETNTYRFTGTRETPGPAITKNYEIEGSIIDGNIPITAADFSSLIIPVDFEADATTATFDVSPLTLAAPE